MVYGSFVGKYTGPMDGMGLEKKTMNLVFLLYVFFLTAAFPTTSASHEDSILNIRNHPYDPSG